MSKYTTADLLAQAKVALDRSHAPYAHAYAGVALQTDLGIFLGCTLENCAYPNSLCAVQSALVNAVSSGAKRVDHMAILTKGDGTIEPCGRCIQVAAEYGDYPVTLQEEGKPEVRVYKVSELLRPGISVPKTEFQTERRKANCPDASSYTFKPNLSPAHLDQARFEELCRAAIQACHGCYTPTSNFPVGAAILTDKERIVSGANIECHVIGLGICAERTTMCKMVANDEGRPKAIAIVCAILPDFGRPCGGCRQNLVEFGNYPVFQIQLDHKNKTIDVETTSTLGQLPGAFCPEGFEASFN